MTSPKATTAGILFASTSTNSAYLSRKDHQPFSTDRRNKWAPSCPPPDEREVFCDAETEGWRDTRPQLWGIKQDLQVLGLEDRRLAKFPDPSNTSDPWHGYPVSALDPKREIEHRPDSELVDRWVACGLISKQQASRIKRGKI